MSAIANPPEMSMSDRARMAYLDRLNDETAYLNRVAFDVADEILGSHELYDVEVDPASKPPRVDFKIEDIEFRVSVETINRAPKVADGRPMPSNYMIAGIHEEELRKLSAYRGGAWVPIEHLSDLGRVISKPAFYGVAK